MDNKLNEILKQKANSDKKLQSQIDNLTQQRQSFIQDKQELAKRLEEKDRETAWLELKHQSC